jgi:hypothetical protein
MPGCPLDARSGIRCSDDRRDESASPGTSSDCTTTEPCRAPGPEATPVVGDDLEVVASMSAETWIVPGWSGGYACWTAVLIASVTAVLLRPWRSLPAPRSAAKPLSQPRITATLSGVAATSTLMSETRWPRRQMS